jgi:hypothetical protein
MNFDFIPIKKTHHKNNFALVISFVFMFFLSFGTSIYGQSKKKAIQWINTNGVSLSKIGNNTSNPDDSSLYFSILEVDKDSIYYTSKCNSNINAEGRHSILLKDILYEDVSTLEKRDNSCVSNISNFLIKVRSVSKEKNGRNKKIETITDFYFPFEDEDKATRVVKAILDLAKLKGAKENIQYY